MKAKVRKRVPLSKTYAKGDGYILVWDPDHPNAKKTGYLLEHTHVMSTHLKRPLIKNESVHHLNGVKGDNRIENLELWTRPPRKGIRVSDAIKDCIDFLESYGYTVGVGETGIKTCE